VRGKEPSDLNGIVDALCRLSQLCVDFPEILEMAVNPLLVKPERGGGGDRRTAAVGRIRPGARSE